MNSNLNSIPSSSSSSSSPLSSISSTNPFKILSSALIVFFAPSNSTSNSSPLLPLPPPLPPPNPSHLFPLIDSFLDLLKLPSSSLSRPSSLPPPSSSAILLSSSDQALNPSHLLALLESLLKLSLASPPSPLQADTLLLLLDKITLDNRARPLLASLDYSLIHSWWSSLLLPSLTCLPHSRSPSSEQSLVNLLANALATDPHAPLPPPSPPLALQLFALYKRQHLSPARTTARNSLLSWGKAAPKELFALIDALLSSPPEEPDREDDQSYALTLLIDFATSSPYSIHNVLSTGLIGSLLRTTLDPLPAAPSPIRLATDALLLILPRIPTAIDGCLALLLVLLAHLLCWPRSPNAPPDAQPTLEPAQTALFALLYGLAPCTLLEFVRTPTSALAALADRIPPAGAPTIDPTTVDESMLRRLVIPLAAQHRLAQDLLINTPEAERATIGEGGLNLFESAELIERCERNMIVKACEDAEPIPIPLPVPLFWSKTSASASLNEEESGSGSVLELKHENMMLKNKLNVERYLKQQHLQQLGSLHKQNILGASLEAENQNLHAINKELQRKLTEALERLHQHTDVSDTTPTDTATSTGTTNASQNTKFKRLINLQTNRYREEMIKLGEAKKELSHRLKIQEEMFGAQKGELSSVETDAHALRNELKLLQPRLESIAELEIKNDALSKALLTWDDDLRRFRESRIQIDVIRGEWKRFESLERSSEIEKRKLREELRNLAEVNERLRLENRAHVHHHHQACDDDDDDDQGDNAGGGGEVDDQVGENCDEGLGGIRKKSDEDCRNLDGGGIGRTGVGGGISGGGGEIRTVVRESLVGCLKRVVEELREENVRLRIACGVNGVGGNGGGGSSSSVNGLGGNGGGGGGGDGDERR